MVGAWALTMAGHIIVTDIHIMAGGTHIMAGDTLIMEAIGLVIIMVIGMAIETVIIMVVEGTIREVVIILIMVIPQHIALVGEVPEVVRFLDPVVDDQEVFQVQVLR